MDYFVKWIAWIVLQYKASLAQQHVQKVEKDTSGGSAAAADAPESGKPVVVNLPPVFNHLNQIQVRLQFLNGIFDSRSAH